MITEQSGMVHHVHRFHGRRQVSLQERRNIETGIARTHAPPSARGWSVHAQNVLDSGRNEQANPMRAVREHSGHGMSPPRMRPAHCPSKARSLLANRCTTGTNLQASPASRSGGRALRPENGHRAPSGTYSAILPDPGTRFITHVPLATGQRHRPGPISPEAGQDRVGVVNTVSLFRKTPGPRGNPSSTII